MHPRDRAEKVCQEWWRNTDTMDTRDLWDLVGAVTLAIAEAEREAADCERYTKSKRESFEE